VAGCETPPLARPGLPLEIDQVVWSGQDDGSDRMAKAALLWVQRVEVIHHNLRNRRNNRNHLHSCSPAVIGLCSIYFGCPIVIEIDVSCQGIALWMMIDELH